MFRSCLTPTKLQLLPQQAARVDQIIADSITNVAITMGNLPTALHSYVVQSAEAQVGRKTSPNSVQDGMSYTITPR